MILTWKPLEQLAKALGFRWDQSNSTWRADYFGGSCVTQGNANEAKLKQQAARLAALEKHLGLIWGRVGNNAAQHFETKHVRTTEVEGCSPYHEVKIKGDGWVPLEQRL